MGMNGSVPPGRRAAIVAGLRTPFVKAGTDFKDLSAVELGALVVNEPVARSGIPPKEFDSVVFGKQIPADGHAIGREMVFALQLPQRVQAHTVARACATSSRRPPTPPIRSGSATPTARSRAARSPVRRADLRHPRARAGARRALAREDARRPRPILSALRPKDTPQPPALKEPTTASRWGRAPSSWRRRTGSARGAGSRRVREPPPRGRGLGERQARRRGDARPAGGCSSDRVEGIPSSASMATLEALAALRPVFDRRYGTITAGNASPLTDGAAALVLMSEEKARALDPALGFVLIACTPTPRSTRATSSCRGRRTRRRSRSTAPACGSRTWTPWTCTRRSVAQVLSNLKAFASKDFAERELGRSGAARRDRPREAFFLNVQAARSHGHPFAATGARMILQTLRELERRKGQHALITVWRARSGRRSSLEREDVRAISEDP